LSARYCVGIDLGTTHSAISYQELDAKEGRGAHQALLPVPQLVSPGTVESRQLLPSFVYLSAKDEFPAQSLVLPWGEKSEVVVGELARSHGAKVPSRLVSSAKSWLAHGKIDRRAAFLPAGLEESVQKLSPVDATTKLLQHLRHAWNHAFTEHPLESQEVVITVPASFDPGACALTEEAASRAGFGAVTLLEEPQAALYAWLEAHPQHFRKVLKKDDIVLVVDIGGGTTDFSLIQVAEESGEFVLKRLAVGDHILLGGDNMDLALAHAAAAKLKAQGKSLDAWQMNALVYACRAAKETLLGSSAPEELTLTVPGRGSSLLGAALRTTLQRSEVQALVLDGFFPVVESVAQVQTPHVSGLRQFGLPYASDAAITRHLAAFLAKQNKALEGKARPTHLLLNGGVLKAAAIVSRLTEQFSRWALPVSVLDGADLDLAVARGAAHFGWVKRGHGIRIRGGTARAYYVGVEAGGLAIPGFSPPVRALCVAPIGMEEGSAADVSTERFGLVVGEPTSFRFFSSPTRRDDVVGTFVDDVDELIELPRVETTLAAEQSSTGDMVPVHLGAAVSALGALELSARDEASGRQWKLTFSVRGDH
jgi:molecular chaperone DnaK (HSP70)